MALRSVGSIFYDKEKNRWTIDSLEPHAAIRLKNIFQKIPRWITPPIHLPNIPDQCLDLEWFISRYKLEITNHDLKYLIDQKNAHLNKMEELERILLPDYVPKEFKIKGSLRDYQSKGVEVYLKNGRLLVGDDIGLGKTLVAIGSFCDLTTLPAAVVCQTHLPNQWKEQIEKFTDLKVHIIKKTTPYDLPKADVYIFKYSNISGWTDIFTTGFFQSLVLDEVQELRRDSSAKYQAGRILSKSVKRVLGLSATPIYNYGDEIFNVLDLINEGCLGSKYEFMREWGGYNAGISDPKALGTYLRENLFMLRRTREEVGYELPAVNKIIHTVDYDEDAVLKVEGIAKQLAIKVTTGSFIERGQAARELDIMVRQATGVSKAKYVAEYVKLFLENNEPVLLAGWHRSVYDIWLEELKKYKPVMYTGSESAAEKEASKNAFISGETNLMIISLRSGIGLDGLQRRGKIVVIGELDWSPQVMEQLIGRLNRDGQTDQVTAIYLVSESGSDPLMIDLLGLKSSESNAIINPTDALQTVVSDDSRIKALAERLIRSGMKN